MRDVTGKSESTFAEALARLESRYGERMGFAELAEALGYPSIQAARQAYYRGTLPIPMRRMPPRRRLYAKTRDVAMVLASGARGGIVRDDLPIVRLERDPVIPADLAAPSEQALEIIVRDLRVLGPTGIVVARPLESGRGRYGVLRGHDLVLAASQCGLKALPCVVQRLSDRDAYGVWLRGLLAQTDRDGRRQARALLFGKRRLGLDAAALAELTGQPEPWIRRQLAWASAPEEVARLMDPETYATFRTLPRAMRTRLLQSGAGRITPGDIERALRHGLMPDQAAPEEVLEGGAEP